MSRTLFRRAGEDEVAGIVKIGEEAIRVAPRWILIRSEAKSRVRSSVVSSAIAPAHGLFPSTPSVPALKTTV